MCTVCVILEILFALDLEVAKNPSVLPWLHGDSANQEGITTMSDTTSLVINPGEYVLQTLFGEFTILAEKKIDRLMKESFVSTI